MREPRTIRYFGTFEKAENACKILQEAGFEAEVVEDKFVDHPLPHYNIPARFRLNVEREKINEVARLLAGKMNKK